VNILATRFGPVPIEPEDIIRFPHGLIGMRRQQKWVLLADCRQEAIAWLQSAELPSLALPVVSPRRFVPEYRLHVSRQQLEMIHALEDGPLYVLVVVAVSDGWITLNLRAPLVINLARHVGCQVITNDEAPVAYKVGTIPQRRQIA